MDVGYYISELLREYGEINVPGLGFFSNTRVNGYYSDKDGKFYPPNNRVRYKPEYAADDDTMAGYLSGKKNISLSSARYFIEKYVSNLTLSAAAEETPLANIGWFSVQQSALVFRPADSLTTDPEFFGYPPVKLKRIGAVTEKKISVNTAPSPFYESRPPVRTKLSPYQSKRNHDEDDSLNAYRKKNSINTWLYVLMAILLTIGIVLLVNRYDPVAFSAITSLGNKAAPPLQPVIKVSPVDSSKTRYAETDTSASKKNLVKDTVSKNTPPDSITAPYFVIMGGSFKDTTGANTAIANYKKLGVPATLLERAPGRSVKVSLGTYKTRGEAEAARKQLVLYKKVKKDIYTLEIKKK